MKCTNCGAETSDEAWNCGSCRMNVYWASQHYDDLATIRLRQSLPESAPTPPFLLKAHERAMTERVERDGTVEHKVRVIARQVMRRAARAGEASSSPMPANDGTHVESGWTGQT
jgi:hypothetical protein